MVCGHEAKVVLLRIASLILVSCWTIPCLAGEQVSPKAHAGVALRHGIRLLAENKYAEAQREFLAATQTDPASAEAFFYLAMAELRLGNAPDAERSLRQSLKLNPRSVNTLYNLGVLLLDGKK